MSKRTPGRLHRHLRAAAWTWLWAAACTAGASEFSVTPTGVELRPGAMSDTITVINHGAQPLRVSVRLMEWSQDAQGNDVYGDNTELVYFPRQLEVPPDSRRVVRVGARTPATASERAYRLYIEEQPEPLPPGGRPRVNVAFRFGVPVFLPPAAPQAALVAAEPVLANGRLSVQVRNDGNQHVRINTLRVEDGAGFRQEVQGWYTLSGAQHTYSVQLPGQACRQAKRLQLTLEGSGVRIERKIDVDPERCG